MKISFKSVCLGFVSGVLVMGTIPAIAKTVEDYIKVSYRNIKIYADGNLVNTSGDNEAFIYNGTTYLPVRAVGEAFNKVINWDGKNSAVYLGIQPTTTGQPTVLLDEMDYFTKSASITDLPANGKDNIGNIHGSGFLMWRGYTEYLLDGKYRKFSGIVGLSYDGRDISDTDGRVLKIYGDGRLLYTSPIMIGGIKPVSFNIDTTGVLNLRLECEGYNICIYDAGFYA